MTSPPETREDSERAPTPPLPRLNSVELAVHSMLTYSNAIFSLPALTNLNDCCGDITLPHRPSNICCLPFPLSITFPFSTPVRLFRLDTHLPHPSALFPAAKGVSVGLIPSSPDAPALSFISISKFRPLYNSLLIPQISQLLLWKPRGIGVEIFIFLRLKIMELNPFQRGFRSICRILSGLCLGKYHIVQSSDLTVAEEIFQCTILNCIV